MRRWKLFLILVLAVILLHILIIRIFIIGSGSNEEDLRKDASLPAPVEPEVPDEWKDK